MFQTTNQYILIYQRVFKNPSDGHFLQVFNPIPRWVHHRLHHRSGPEDLGRPGVRTDQRMWVKAAIKRRATNCQM